MTLKTYAVLGYSEFVVFLLLRQKNFLCYAS